MIVTFFGHSNFRKTAECEEKILSILQEKVGDKVATAYLGNHGEFDCFAYHCCLKYKEKHPYFTLIYVTPYMTLEFQKRHLKDLVKQYDGILYPEIEDKPIRFAISYRNKFMVDKADYIITYVSHNWGGAYISYKYAKRKGKELFNLTQFEDK